MMTALRRRQHVERQQPERRRAIDQDEIVVVHASARARGAARVSRFGRSTSSSSAPTRSCVAGRTCRKGSASSWRMMSARRAAVDDGVVEREADLVAPDPDSTRGVPLRIGIDEQRALFRHGERRGQVHRRRRLADAALLIGNRDDSGHERGARLGRRSREREDGNIGGAWSRVDSERPEPEAGEAMAVANNT